MKHNKQNRCKKQKGNLNQKDNLKKKEKYNPERQLGPIIDEPGQAPIIHASLFNYLQKESNSHSKHFT